MKKVAFYLHNKNLNNVNFVNILQANPGIGGTEYMILCISTLLSVRQNNIQVTLMAQRNELMPKELNVEIVNDLADAINKAVNDNFDILIFKHEQYWIEQKVLENVPDSLSLIAWCQNFAHYKNLRYYSRNPSIKSLVMVGNEQADLYRDFISFKKTSYIYNGILIDNADVERVRSTPYNSRKNNIVYIGSIVPSKGFHLLAKAWKNVIKKVPDAQLYVIGSGKLYDRNATLGEYNIAEKEYEDSFINYLLDEESKKIMPSVHLMGVLGETKKEILLSCKVGVPNPSGLTETFGISAVEMQNMGCLLTTKKCPGYLDTVFENGILYESEDSLADNIVTLLHRDDNQYENMLSFLKEKFSFDALLPKWEQLLHSDLNKEVKIEPILVNQNFRMKKNKEFMRKLKKAIPVLSFIPPIELLLNHVFDRKTRF